MLPTAKVVKARLFNTILKIPPLFLCGFLWEGFALSTDCSIDSSCYYFLTGIGAAIGTFVGHLLAYLASRGDHDIASELYEAFIHSFGILFGPGTTWQRIVNDASDWGLTFTGAFFYMWLLSALLWFASVTAAKITLDYVLIQSKIEKSVKIDKIQILKFFFVAISIGLADAFFLGTVSDTFDNNWLGPPFGVNQNTSTFVAMLKAGTASLVGFLVSQFIQIFFIRKNPTDIFHDEDVPSDIIGLEVSNQVISDNYA